MSKLIALQLLRENKVGLRCPDRESQHYKWVRRSIERQGLATPLVVRVGTDCEDGSNFYEIIDGHHRFQVLKALKSEAVRCNVIEADDLQVLILQLRLNKGPESKVQPEELANGLKRVMMHDPLCTLVQIARDIPMNVRRIERALGLHKIATGAGISNLVRDGKICLMNAYALAKLPHHEQINWVDRAKCMNPPEFIPACNKREQAVFGRRRRFVKKGMTGQEFINHVNYNHSEYLDHEKEQIARVRQGLEPLPLYGQNPCGEVTLGEKRERMIPISQVHDEVTLTFPRKVVDLPADATAMRDEIARMKIFMKQTIEANALKDHDDDVIAMAAANWHNAKFDMGIYRPAGQKIGRMSGKGFAIAPSGYELLHGRPKEQTPKQFSELKRTVTFTEKEPISRKGWDHVQYNGHRAYCHGDILVWQSTQWNVLHPTIDCGNEFDTTLEAMAWVEEQFDGR
jgi:hypothetical protein